MAKEAWPTKGYPSPGLLAATRRSASSPTAPGEPPEGIAIGSPDQIIRELKKTLDAAGDAAGAAAGA